MLVELQPFESDRIDRRLDIAADPASPALISLRNKVAEAAAVSCWSRERATLDLSADEADFLLNQLAQYKDDQLAQIAASIAHQLAGPELSA